MIYKYEIKFKDLASPQMIQLKDKEFELRFKYNERFDFITVEVYQENEFLHSTKLTYGNDIFAKTKLSDISLVVMSEEDLDADVLQNIQVTKENFGSRIFLMYSL